MRDRSEETEDYPGLVVCDERVTGSITIGASRLPLWAFAGVAVLHGWDEVERGWEPSEYGWDARKQAEFLGDLLEQRHEFARLLCVLADVERKHREKDRYFVWRKKDRRRVADQLRRCLAEIEED